VRGLVTLFIEPPSYVIGLGGGALGTEGCQYFVLFSIQY
jgi:hypothetical protein